MKVLVVMGSDSDFPVVSSCLDELDKFGVEYEARVVSAHRTPDLALELARTAEEKGFGVIIAAAGKAAHLGGVLASSTTLPVIGIPIGGSALAGSDALYSIVQMPPGVPVATMAIDGAVNAAIFAVQVLSLSAEHQDLKEKLRDYKENMVQKVYAKDQKLNKQLADRAAEGK